MIYKNIKIGVTSSLVFQVSCYFILVQNRDWSLLYRVEMCNLVLGSLGSQGSPNQLTSWLVNNTS